MPSKSACFTCVALLFLGLLVFTQIQGTLPRSKFDSWVFPLQAWTFNTVAYRMYAPFPAYQRDLPSFYVTSAVKQQRYQIADRALLESLASHFNQRLPRLTRVNTERWGNFVMSIGNGLDANSERSRGFARQKFSFVAKLLCAAHAEWPDAKVSLDFTEIEFGRFMEGPKTGQTRSVLVYDCAAGGLLP